jgi:hypothetical protein
MIVPKKLPVHDNTAHRRTSTKEVLSGERTKALATSNMSPVHAPHPVREINRRLTGNPTAPDKNRAMPLPANQGFTDSPISKPTEAVKIPPKPTKIPRTI